MLDFPFNAEGLMAIVEGSVTSPPRYLTPQDFKAYVAELASKAAPQDIYFAPAERKTPGNEKVDVLGSMYLWVDVDSTEKPLSTLAPTITVFSGHGWHLYWKLDKPVIDIERLESLNKILSRDVPGGDLGCWNANRLLRLPGTTNTKDSAKPVRVEIRKQMAVVYSAADIDMLNNLDKATRHKVRTGDRRGYHSRSERDWAVITALMQAGASDDLITKIFSTQPVGDKVNDPTTAEEYLSHTIARARNRAPITPKGTIEEHEDGYYVEGRRGATRISTFVIHPKLLLDGALFKSEDALVGDVVASGHTWPDITFTRSAFTSVNRLDRECPVAAWQWLGRDDEVRILLPHLMDLLRDAGLPKVNATKTLGLMQMKNTWYFVGDQQVMSASETWSSPSGPIAWLPSRTEYPKLDLSTELTSADLKIIRQIPYVNEPEVTWPMLGWYAASLLKPWIEEQGMRFPILNVSGTRGSGKTTLIQRVFMPLFGQVEPKSYDAGTTKFVMLAVLGSTNAIPVAFSEFRYESVEKFLRYILLSYDSGHDPRGRADQSTVDYELSAPFSVDGEDLVADPAARERVVVALMRADTVRDGTKAYEVFQRIRKKVPNCLGSYAKHVLRMISTSEGTELLEEIREEVFNRYRKVPERIRCNYAIAHFGNRIFCKAFGLTAPEVSVYDKSIGTVFDFTAKRSRTLSDDFIEDMINNHTQSGVRTKIIDNVYWFQMSSAHSWWTIHRRRQGRSVLEKDSILSQLKEAPYMESGRLVEGVWMYGVDLAKAVESGLDIPSAINSREFHFKF